MKHVILIALVITTAFSSAVYSDNKNQDSELLEAATFLTESEKNLIRAKRNAIIKQLVEDAELSSVRAQLKKQQEQKAWTETVKGMFPLDAEQVKQVRKKTLDISRATNTPLNNVEQINRTVYLDLARKTPVKVNVVPGYASSLVFYDQSGQPWPVNMTLVGDPTSFKVEVAGEQKNIIGLSALKQFSESNVLINLNDIHVPIVIQLIGNESKVDARLDVRLPKFGPNADLSSYGTKPVDLTNTPVMDLLAGKSLEESKGIRYDISGVEGVAWYLNGSVFIRTEAELISPEYLDFQSSATGSNVYQIAPVSNLLFSENGQMINARLSKAYTQEIEYEASIFDGKELKH